MSKKIENKISTERTTFLNYKQGAKKRNLFFDLEFHEFVSIISEPCFYCGQEYSRLLRTSNGKYHYYKSRLVPRNGVDRIDNDVGYIKENCVPCCTMCNSMKMHMPLEDFFIRVSRIYNLHIKGS